MNRYLQTARRWYEGTPERALDQAYDAALMIKAIEDEHFGGRPIVPRPNSYRDSTTDYFETELKKYLKNVRLRLAEFKASRSIFYATDGSASVQAGSTSLSDRERSAVILEKLRFIDEVINRYQTVSTTSTSIVPVSDYSATEVDTDLDIATNGQARTVQPANKAKNSDGILDKTGVLPRSIVGTLNRIRRDLDPDSEEQVVQTYRSAKEKTRLSIRFVLLLIIVPLLTQQLSKAIVVSPVVDFFRNPEEAELFVNFELEEEALQELRIFEERLRFERLLGREESLSETQMDNRLKEKAQEIGEHYSHESSNAIKNVFADLAAFVAVALVIVTNRREIAVLKSFMDETVYGLSDSAKAFIIILFTDIFVGFHSPHGWEVLLEALARHVGLPANQAFIGLFIATFPVILDTIFKYWIFRYLNRISPSAVATYRNMNE
ncbi:proton extrusion protein PcxA [Leptolyngbya sp. FACHB-36]|uniref:proton extrusion protein PcxA n=1 Tax=Leptolyngbya sp. FACHB-36 TaxID=2692808 RepID=UPI001F556C57|nr:proton extrusion protein PcxA [Leptolyngbya sp. FACHB-36]